MVRKDHGVMLVSYNDVERERQGLMHKKEERITFEKRDLMDLRSDFIPTCARLRSSIVPGKSTTSLQQQSL